MPSMVAARSLTSCFGQHGVTSYESPCCAVRCAPAAACVPVAIVTAECACPQENKLFYQVNFYEMLYTIQALMRKLGLVATCEKPGENITSTDYDRMENNQTRPARALT